MAQEWKVRSMDEADSRAAVAAAERAKVTTAVWLGGAIRERIARERDAVTGEVIHPDSAPSETNGSIGELRELALLARELTPLNRDSRDSEPMRLARSLVRDRLMALRTPATQATSAPAPRMLAAPEVEVGATREDGP